MKTNTKYIIPVILFFMLTQFLNSCSLSKQNDIACPDFKSKRQQTDVSLKKPDYFRFLKSDRSKQAYSKKDEFDANKGFKEKEIRDEYPSDYLPYKTFELIVEKFVLSKHLQKRGQQVTAHNLKKTMKEKSHNKYKISDILSDKLCDTIILKSGVKIPATEIKIESKNIRFKTCADQNIQGKQIVKELVNKIKYSNGKEQLIAYGNSKKIIDQSGTKKLNISAFIAFIFALVSSPLSWFFGFINIWLTLILCPLSILLGIISLAEIKKNPGKYSGKGFAIIAIILGLITGGIILLFIFNPPL